MDVGDVVVANVIAIGADGHHSFMSVNNDKITKPIIIKERLKFNETYKIEIINNATNFYIAKVIEKIEKENDV